MPCRSYEDECRNPNSGEVSRLERENFNLQKENQEIEAGMCAVFSELETNPNVDLPKVIKAAAKNGDVDLSDIWAKHQAKDVARLKKDLKKFSKHELDMIKTILNK
jgi:hypothetical protein